MTDQLGMGCKQCKKNREKALAKRREIHNARLAKLREECEQGHEVSCMNLQELLAAQAYRENNRFRSELHRKA